MLQVWDKLKDKFWQLQETQHSLWMLILNHRQTGTSQSTVVENWWSGDNGRLKWLCTTWNTLSSIHSYANNMETWRKLEQYEQIWVNFNILRFNFRNFRFRIQTSLKESVSSQSFFMLQGFSLKSDCFSKLGLSKLAWFPTCTLPLLCMATLQQLRMP